MAFDFLQRFQKKEAEKTAQKRALKAEKPSETPVEEKKADLKARGKSEMGPRVFLAPHISEKAGGMMSSEGETKYIFKVMPKANKIMVKKAVEDRYHVKVGSVHVMNMPEKKRRVGRIEGTKSGFKKAIVTLKEGGVIDAF